MRALPIRSGEAQDALRAQSIIAIIAWGIAQVNTSVAGKQLTFLDSNVMLSEPKHLIGGAGILRPNPIGTQNDNPSSSIINKRELFRCRVGPSPA